MFAFNSDAQGYGNKSLLEYVRPEYDGDVGVPVVNVFYTPRIGADYGNNLDLVPAVLANGGNELRYAYPH